MPKKRRERPTPWISRNNAGWQLWNMSKEVSRVKVSSRKAREVLDNPQLHEDWPTEALHHLARLAELLEIRAAEADGLWQCLQGAAGASAPDLVEQAEGISVIHNQGDDPRAAQAIRSEWGSGRRCVERGRALGEGAQSSGGGTRRRLYGPTVEHLSGPAITASYGVAASNLYPKGAFHEGLVSVGQHSAVP